jgi:hypothetical protein
VSSSLFLGAGTVTEVACLRSNTELIGSVSIVDGNSSYQTLTQHALNGKNHSRMTGKPEVKSRPNLQPRGREVAFEEIAIDLL